MILMAQARRFLLPVVLLALAAGPAAAQVVRGSLLDDDTGQPIDGGIMTLMLGDRPVDRILSDSTGHFSLHAPAVGVYSVTAQRIGYQETRSALLSLEFGDTLTVEYRLRTEAILLEPLLVVATSRAGQAQFNRRMAAGVGQFVTRATLDSLDLWHPALAFRHVEDFFLGWGWGAFESGQVGMIPRPRSFRGSGCLGYVVDGVVAGPRFRSDRGKDPWSLYPLDGLTEGEIMGMEFYRYAGEVPEELRHLASDAMNDMGTDQMCGLVVIWTRARWR